MADLTPHITTHYTTVPAPFPGAPAFDFHLTRLKDTLFVWVGTSSVSGAADGPDEDARASTSGSKKVAGEWAVAMPSRGNIPATATPLFRSGATDTALPLSQRLAKRFPSNQVHLSLALPASLTAPQGPQLDPYASKALLVMEKKLGTWLVEVLGQEAA